MGLFKRYIERVLLGIFKSQEFETALRDTLQEKFNSPITDEDDYFLVEQNISVLDFIKEISFYELVRMSYYESMAEGKIPVLLFADNKIFYYYVSDAKYGDNSKLTLWNIIFETYYTKVDEYHKFVFFDDVNNILEYLDDTTEKNILSAGTAVIPVLKNNDKNLEAILNKINKKNIEESIPNSST